MKIQYLLILIMFLTTTIAKSQFKAEIKVLPKITEQSVKLRWAPTTPLAWQLGNKYGYTVVRFRYEESGENYLKDSTLLSGKVLKVKPLNEWETLVNQNNFAAIAAQAIYGESFEFEEGAETGLINRNADQENRFGFSLSAADQSIEVAEMMGLFIEDFDVVKGESYVYRINLASVDEQYPINSGSAIVKTDDVAQYPAPEGLKAIFENKSVKLIWDSFFQRNIYNYYIIELSEDGKKFTKRNESNFLQLRSGDKQEEYLVQYVDSLARNYKTYYYRIRGVDAFGEIGPPSNVVSGSGRAPLAGRPEFMSAELKTDGNVYLNWTFPDSLYHIIDGYQIERSTKREGPFIPINEKILSPETEHFIDSESLPTNYYIIKALTSDGREASSIARLVQAIDSIPPATPVGLAGIIDSTGVVRLTWNENKEPDLKGYYVYTSYTENGEFIQSHDDNVEVTNSTYSEKVVVKTLNRDLYYRVVSYDKRGNISDFSAPILVKKPDLVPPSTPYIHPAKQKDGKVYLTWVGGSDKDLKGYRLWRKENDTLTLVIETNKSTLTYTDDAVKVDNHYRYYLVAVDRSGLVSDTVNTRVYVPDNSRLPTVKKINYELDQDLRTITVNWKYDQENIDGFIIYRAMDNGPLRLLKKIDKSKRTFLQRNIQAGVQYKYAIQAYNKNRSSSISELVLIK